MKYLRLSRLEVNNANALAVPWIVAAPSPTAYVGFAHRLGRDLGTRTAGVAVVHHDFHLCAERIDGRVLPHQFRSATFINKADYSSKSKSALSLQPTVRCNVVVSLVLELADDAALGIDALQQQLLQCRIAGGSIRAVADVEVHVDQESATRAIRGGFSVVERGDLLQPQSDREDRLDAFLRVTDPNAESKESWLSPALLGYRAITPITKRQNSRDDYRHAFAEPLIGLTQFVSLREKGLRFWRYHHLLESDVFVVTDSSISPT